jgi:hypothetical protein
MIESLATESAGLAIAELIGSVPAGMFLMFYRDIAANEHALQNPEWDSENRETLSSQIGALKAATLGLGLTVLGSLGALILFDGSSIITGAGFISAGLAVGAGIAHAAWRFGRISHEEEARRGQRWPLSGIAREIFKWLA